MGSRVRVHGSRSRPDPYGRGKAVTDMGTPHVDVLTDEGLGNTAYLVDLGDGSGLAVDPSRDLRALRTAADRRGLRIAYVAETHLHADFVSGARQLSAEGARVLASAEGQREFAHRGLADEEEVDLGGLVLRALRTPGHTDEHLSYVLLAAGQPVGAFTGGSLMVGSAARTDLVDPDRTEDLARALHHSLRRLATLPDDTRVWPTHGAGSFCAAPAEGPRTSTIGTEKASNPLLRAAGEDSFVALLLGGLGSYPIYFDRLGEVNRRGPRILTGEPELPPLGPSELQLGRSGGAEVVDVRPAEDFAAGHVPGALSIALRASFATWLGWLVDADRPLVVVRREDQDPAEICWQALKVGYERIRGELAGGPAAWRAAGHAVAAFPRLRPAEVDPGTVVDVRQDAEWAEGHLPGARHVELGDLAARAYGLPGDALVTMCSHGDRATTAASLLARAGRRVAVLPGSPAHWSDETGTALATGDWPRA